MTRAHKCDACRKAKIKCDEALPTCSRCIRVGKKCTHSGCKKPIVFVNCAESPSKPATIKQQGTQFKPLQSSATLSQSHYSEDYSLLAKWLSMTPQQGCKDNSLTEFYKMWEICVPQYIGRSQAINYAARCFMDCKQAFANPTIANMKAVRISNVAAVKGIRIALTEGGQTSCGGDILLGIQMLYMVEAILMRIRNALFVHVCGLLSLLERHKKRLETLDKEESTINSALFWCNLESGLTSAVMLRQDHRLDNDMILLDIPDFPIGVTGVSNSAVQALAKCVAKNFILVPRLIRKARQLGELPTNYNLELETMKLAQSLYSSKYDAAFIAEAFGCGELGYLPTVLGRVAKVVPVSYRFNSRRISSLLMAYWAIRMCICGLVDTLLTISPVSSLIFNANEVHAEDIRAATDAMMSAQHTLTKQVSDDRVATWLEQTWLQKLLQMGFGTWDRFEKRLTNSAIHSQEDPEGRLEWVRSMKDLAMYLSNELLTHIGADHMTMEDMQRGTLTLAACHVTGEVILPTIEN